MEAGRKTLADTRIWGLANTGIPSPHALEWSLSATFRPDGGLLPPVRNGGGFPQPLRSDCQGARGLCCGNYPQRTTDSGHVPNSRASSPPDSTRFGGDQPEPSQTRQRKPVRRLSPIQASTSASVEAVSSARHADRTKTGEWQAGREVPQPLRRPVWLVSADRPG